MKKIFIHRSILIISLLLLTVLIYNFCLDFYGVFWRDANNIFFTPNSIYVKLDHVLCNKKKYDSFLFGSSRAGNIDVRKIKKGNYYNMFFFSGIPSEWLKGLQILLENNIEIKNIIFAVDEFAYKMDPEARLDELHFKQLPITIEDKFTFFASYLFERPKFTDLVARYTEISKRNIEYEFGESGNYYRPREETRIKKQPEHHRKERMFYHKYEKDPANRIDKTIDEIIKIINICKKNNIAIKVILNPIHKNFYLNEDITTMNTFKKRLAEVSDFYDFCSLTPFVEDNYNFYDQYHYRPHIGNMILERLFGYPKTGVPEWFGIKVTKKNIDKYTKKLSEQWYFYNKTKNIHVITQDDLN